MVIPLHDNNPTQRRAVVTLAIIAICVFVYAFVQDHGSNEGAFIYEHAAVPCELAIQKFFMNTISVAKLADAHGAFPRGQRVEGVPSSGQAPPGYGYVRGCAKGEPRK